MRISTSSFFELNTLAMGLQQQNLFNVQQRLSAGTKFLTAGDDPVGAARALGVTETLAESSQYAASRERATLALKREETALDSTTVLLQNIKTLTVQAGNGTLSDADRAALATTIQSNLDQLVGIANSDDGRSVFQTVQGGAGYVTSGLAGNSGTGVFSAVSVVDATSADYGKDFTISFTGGNYTVQTQDTPPVVAASGAFTAGSPIVFGGLQLSFSGTPADGDSFDVSTAKNAGTDIFATIGELVTALRTPLSGGGDAAKAQLLNALSTANVKVTNAHDNVLTVLSSVGSRMNEIDALDTGGAARDLMDKSYLSAIQDLDPASAISEFYQRQTSLQATQMTFAKLASISLFNYL